MDETASSANNIRKTMALAEWYQILKALGVSDFLSPGSILGAGLQVAIEACERCLLTFDPVEDHLVWAALHSTLGSFYRETFDRTNDPGDCKLAEEHARAALAALGPEEEPDMVARFSLNLGNILNMQYEASGLEEKAEEAESYYLSAIAGTDRKTDLVNWISAHAGLGSLLVIGATRFGRLQDIHRGEAALQTGLDALPKRKSPDLWAVLQNHLASLYDFKYQQTHDRKYLDLTLAAYRKALSVRTLKKHRIAWAECQHNMGNILLLAFRETGDQRLCRRAKLAYRNALIGRRKSTEPGLWAESQWSLGNFHIVSYEKSKSKSDIYQAEEAFRNALSEYAGTAAKWAMVQLSLAQAICLRYEDCGETNMLPIATRELEEIVFDDRVDMLPEYVVMWSNVLLARLKVRQGATVEADEAFARAHAAANRRILQSWDIEDRMKVASEDRGLFHEHMQFLLQSGRVFDLLVTADSARARSVAIDMEWMSAAFSKRSSNEQEAYFALRKGVNFLQTSLGRDWRDIESTERGHCLSVSLRSARKRLSAMGEDYGLEPPHVTLQQLQSVKLPPAVAAVEVVLNNDDARALIWRGGNNVTDVHLPGISKRWLIHVMSATPKRRRFLGFHIGLGHRSGEEVDLDDLNSDGGNRRIGWAYYLKSLEAINDVGRFRAVAIQAQFNRLIETTLAELRERFWEPVSAVLGEELLTLTVVPGALLGVLPIQAAAPKHFSVTISPSIYLWLTSISSLLHRESNGGAFIAAPTSDDLRFIGQEITSVSEAFREHSIPLRLEREGCTPDIFLEASRNASYVHFCGHARYNWARPVRSYLSCKGGDLTMQALRDQGAFLGTRLVTLSACETGLSDNLYGSEESAGMPTALMSAGVPTVLATLWPVSDMAASLFMGKFYNQLLSNKCSPTDAFEESVRWLKDSSARDLNNGSDETSLSSMLTEELEASIWDRVSGSEPSRNESRSDVKEPSGRAIDWAAFCIYGALPDVHLDNSASGHNLPNRM